MAMLMGARFAEAGIRVRFLGSWKAGIDALNQDGIRVVEGGRVDLFPAEATADPKLLQGTRLALVLVKSWQTEKAASLLAQILAKEGIAVTLQNGLGNLEILSAALGLKRTALGVTTYGATCLGPGQVRPGGEGMISIQEHQRLPDMINLLKQGGFKVQQVADLSGLIWDKLIINVAINPLTGLLGVANGALLESQAATQLMGMAALEAAEVARAQGIATQTTDPARAAAQVAAATSKNISSMLQDIRRGAPTEISVLSGEVARQGKSLGVSTPINEILTLLIQGKVDLRRKEE